jgi:hypothetical protein
MVKYNEDNPSWKGDLAGYHARHDYIRRRKPQPDICEGCGEKAKLTLANVSGRYLRDVNDWRWACLKCNKSLYKTPHHLFSGFLQVRSRKSYLKYKPWFERYRHEHRQATSEYTKWYRKENREKLLEKSRRYRLAHREKAIRYSRDYYLNNKQKFRDYNRSERGKEVQRIFREKNKEKIAAMRKLSYPLNKEKRRLYNEHNKDKISAQKKLYRLKNKERLKEYYQRNREQFLARMKSYYYNKTKGCN